MAKVEVGVSVFQGGCQGGQKFSRGKKTSSLKGLWGKKNSNFHVCAWHVVVVVVFFAPVFVSIDPA